MRSAIASILLGLLASVCGCANLPPLGEPADDAVRHAALLRTYRRPEVGQAVFQTMIRWGNRGISLTEIVKTTPGGGFSVVGLTGVGTTLYAVRMDPGGQGQVIRKSLPFSDQWLLDGPVAELLLPWNGPDETCPLHRLPDGTWALVCQTRHDTRMFIFDEAGAWRQFRRFSGGRLLSQVSLEWDGRPLPKVMRVDNRAQHYRIVREHVQTSHGP